MIKLLIIISLFLSQHSDTLRRDSYEDSCRRVFLTDVLINYQNSYVVVNIDSCDKKWQEVVPSCIFYKYYVHAMKMSFKGYVGVVTDELMNGAGPYNRCGDSLIIGSKVSQEKVKKLQRISPDNVLKKYFDSNHVVKNKYKDCYYELIFYCYQHLIRVDYSRSQPPHYISKT